MQTLTLHKLVPEEIENIVILVHGYGADGKDLLDLGEAWQAVLPNTLFVAPDAPNRCDGNPMGFQWYPLYDISPPAVIEGTKKAADVLYNLIDDLAQEYNVPVSRIALVGFSQGAMTSLFVGLHYNNKLAGVISYAGLLPITTPPFDIQKPPVLLVHGEADNVVPPMGSIEAHHSLKEWEVESELILRPGLAHGIDREGLEKGQAFLLKNLTK